MVTLDGSDFSESVLPVAAHWARSLALPLTLLNVVTPAAQDALRGADVFEDAQLRLVAKRLQDDGLTVDWDVLHSDDPARAIDERLRASDGAIGVMSTHGRNGLRRIVAGSVVMDVVHRTNAPLLVQQPPSLDARRP
jgi:nucleotide-binding universal stress UspA family protein